MFIEFYASSVYYQLSRVVTGTNLVDMEAAVTSPSGKTERCEIAKLDEGVYSIKFVPKELGVHTVHVKHKGLHIPGTSVIVIG